MEASQVTQDTEHTAALARFSEIPDGGALAVADPRAPDDRLVLLRRGDEVRCFENVCPHAGRPLDWAPGRFLVEDGAVVCAAHGAMFRIPDGACVSGPCRGQSLQALPLRRDGDAVWLDVPGA